eukprot:gb/GEZN01014926.1/.p1 GENE.gb/GEZN01014926.1/~~gb/GEZN01014926.1/.p1  ORF type:complete len:236 (-),score=44.33 gb/GEZN01014926.1/:156-863(-)
MGSAPDKDALSKEDVAKFSLNSFFTFSEIERIYERFRYLGGTNTTSVSARRIVEMPELRVNPFRFRIVEIFGKRKGEDDEDYVPDAREAVDAMASPDKKDNEPAGFNQRDRPGQYDDAMGNDWEEMEFFFVHFVSMLNAFSARASLQVKAYYAFELYDFDGDHFLNTDDIVAVIETTVGKNRMSRQRMLKVAAQVLEESDLDGNLKLSRTEFNRILKRIPDFAIKFQFALGESPT